MGVTHILQVALHAAELTGHVDQRTELGVVVRVAAAGATLRALLEALDEVVVLGASGEMRSTPVPCCTTSEHGSTQDGWVFHIYALFAIYGDLI